MAIKKTKATALKLKKDVYGLGFVLLISLGVILAKESYNMASIISILISLFLYKRYKIYKRGYIGEKKVSRKIMKKLENKYVLFDEIELWNTVTKRKAQIDHILIGEHIIFCIETKNYRGLIQGEQFSHMWQKGHYRNKAVNTPLRKSKLKAIEFYNPLKQNFVHLQVLKDLLYKNGIKGIPIINLVVFADKEVFLNISVKTEDAKVVKLKEMIAEMNQLDSIIRKIPQISPEQKSDIVQIISENKLN